MRGRGHDGFARQADGQGIHPFEAAAVLSGHHQSAEAAVAQGPQHAGVHLAHLVRLGGDVLDGIGESPGLGPDLEVFVVQFEVHAPGVADQSLCALPSNLGRRFSMKAEAPSIMSYEPMACTSMPSPLR